MPLSKALVAAPAKKKTTTKAKAKAVVPKKKKTTTTSTASKSKVPKKKATKKATTGAAASKKEGHWKATKSTTMLPGHAKPKRLYKHTVTGELRVRKMVERAGKRVATYVKVKKTQKGGGGDEPDNHDIQYNAVDSLEPYQVYGTPTTQNLNNYSRNPFLNEQRRINAIVEPHNGQYPIVPRPRTLDNVQRQPLPFPGEARTMPSFSEDDSESYMVPGPRRRW